MIVGHTDDPRVNPDVSFLTTLLADQINKLKEFQSLGNDVCP